MRLRIFIQAQIVRVAEQYLACRRQIHGSSAANEQGMPRVALKPLHLRTYRGLGGIQPRRSVRRTESGAILGESSRCTTR
jgi:hypothetical protein